AVASFRRGGGYLQILLAVTLGRQVFRRHLELLREHGGDSLGAAVRERQVVDVGADRVGVTFDQEHGARVGRNRFVDGIGNEHKALDLMGGDDPRAGIEIDRIDVDARHALEQRTAVADLVERIGALEPFDRRLGQNGVDVGRGRAFRLEDVALARDADHRWRQVDVETRHVAIRAQRVVDDDHLASIRIASQAAQQAAVGPAEGDDADAVRPLHHGHGIAAPLLDANVARVQAETVHLVVADENVPAFLDDGAARLADDDAVALAFFVTRRAQVFDLARAPFVGLLALFEQLLAGPRGRGGTGSPHPGRRLPRWRRRRHIP